MYMGRIYGIASAVVLIFLMLPPFPASAAPVAAVESAFPRPPVEEARFRVYWNGIRLGKIWLYWKEEGGRYETRLDIKTSGVARLFSPQDRGAAAEGRIVRQGGMEYYIPERYSYRTSKKGRVKEITIAFGANGAVKHVRVTPPEAPGSRPEVKKAERDAAYDPMTALRAIGHYVETLSQGGRDSSRRFTVFDGKRLTRVLALPTEETSCGAGCVVARGTRELLAGYTEEEQEKFRTSKESGIQIEMQPAQSRFPRRFSTHTPFGEVSAERY
jgi:hypothetical protein